MAQTKMVNPWKWQDQFSFSQGMDVRGVERMLYCAGQTSVDAEGAPMHAGDMTAQINQALNNLETVLRHAGFTLADVVRLNYYTRDVAAFGGRPGGRSAVSGGWLSASVDAARSGQSVSCRYPCRDRSHGRSMKAAETDSERTQAKTVRTRFASSGRRS